MYALIQNNQIKVGPREWSYSMFASYLINEGVPITDLPREAPKSAFEGQGYKILPVKITNQPSTEYPFEQLSGPFYNINNNDVEGYYNSVPTTLDFAKNALKEIVAGKRYEYEVGGKNYQLQDGTTVLLYTNREDRTTYLDAFMILPDNGSVTFKFAGNVFKTLTKSQLGAIVQAVVGHVQSAFDWESQKNAQIDATTTMQQLRNISLDTPN